MEKYIRSGVELTRRWCYRSSEHRRTGNANDSKDVSFCGCCLDEYHDGRPAHQVINASASISSLSSPRHSTSNDLRVARIVKGRIEKTTLGEIAKCIDEVYEVRTVILKYFWTWKLSALQLAINVDTVIDSILAAKTPKQELYSPPQGGEQYESTHRTICPASAYSVRFKTKARLPHVTVVGVPTVRRAVINEVAAAGAAAKDAVPSRPFEGDLLTLHKRSMAY